MQPSSAPNAKAKSGSKCGRIEEKGSEGKARGLAHGCSGRGGHVAKHPVRDGERGHIDKAVARGGGFRVGLVGKINVLAPFAYICPTGG